MPTSECLILGGGVIGLTLARALARDGCQVRVVDCQAVGREASWAGAGILPAAQRAAAIHPYDQLRGLSSELHRSLAEELLAETGIDTGYQQCGGIYLAHSPGEAAALRGFCESAQDEQLTIEKLDRTALSSLEPALLPLWDAGQIRVAYWLPEEAQLRNPRHLQALAASCRQLGVALDEHVRAAEFLLEGSRVRGVATSQTTFTADVVCVTAGAWTYPLLHELGVETGILPIRGQMVLFAPPQPVLRRIINDGPRYLVPRLDGLVLAGSTEEEAGYVKETTREGVEQLVQFARRVVPELESAEVQQCWAGLRPASFDGLPYLGQVPAYDNLFVAAGHFRSGIYLSPGTARVMSQLLQGQTPEIDLTPFSILRGGVTAGSSMGNRN